MAASEESVTCLQIAANPASVAFIFSTLMESLMSFPNVLALLLASTLALPTLANADTLKKIADSKKIVIGVRESSPPLSYSLGPGKYVGYHVELCEKMVGAIKRRLQINELAVEYAPVTSQNRIPLVQNGTVDIECGTTTNNSNRQKDVAFALTTYVTEVRMAARVDSGIHSVSQLAGKTVASTTGSTAVQVLRKHRRATSVDFKELYGKDHGDAFLLLESGRADAMVIDDNILAGLISLSKSPASYHIVGETLSVEPIAIMFRKDDRAFKDFVDEQIVSMMKTGDLAKVYDKWFMQPIPPKDSKVNLAMSESLKKLIVKPNDKPAEAYQDSLK